MVTGECHTGWGDWVRTTNCRSTRRFTYNGTGVSWLSAPAFSQYRAICVTAALPSPGIGFLGGALMMHKKREGQTRAIQMEISSCTTSQPLSERNLFEVAGDLFENLFGDFY